jgi:flagellar biosynthesis protein FlhB
MMKGQGGITVYNALLFYMVFLLFVGFLSALAGVQILTVGGNPNNIPIPTFDPLNPLSTVTSLFGFFTGLFLTNSTFAIISVVFITPFLILLAYAILQLIRGTG